MSPHRCDNPDAPTHFHTSPGKVSIAPIEDHMCPGERSASAQDVIIREGEAKVAEYSGIVSLLGPGEQESTVRHTSQAARNDASMKT